MAMSGRLAELFVDISLRGGVTQDLLNLKSKMQAADNALSGGAERYVKAMRAKMNQTGMLADKQKQLHEAEVPEYLSDRYIRMRRAQFREQEAMAKKEASLARGEGRAMQSNDFLNMKRRELMALEQQAEKQKILHEVESKAYGSPDFLRLQLAELRAATAQADKLKIVNEQKGKAAGSPEFLALQKAESRAMTEEANRLRIVADQRRKLYGSTEFRDQLKAETKRDTSKAKAEGQKEKAKATNFATPEFRDQLKAETGRDTEATRAETSRRRAMEQNAGSREFLELQMAEIEAAIAEADYLRVVNEQKTKSTASPEFLEQLKAEAKAAAAEADRLRALNAQKEKLFGTTEYRDQLTAETQRDTTSARAEGKQAKAMGEKFSTPEYDEQIGAENDRDAARARAEAERQKARQRTIETPGFGYQDKLEAGTEQDTAKAKADAAAEKARAKNYTTPGFEDQLKAETQRDKATADAETERNKAKAKNFGTDDYRDLAESEAKRDSSSIRAETEMLKQKQKLYGSPAFKDIAKAEAERARQIKKNEDAAHYQRLIAENGKFLGSLKYTEEKLHAIGTASAWAYALSKGAIVGAVAAASPETFQTLTGSMRLLTGEIGSIFIPVMVQVSHWLQRAADWFKALDPETKKTIANWTLIGVAGAGVVMVGTKLLPVLIAITSGIRMVGIAALGAAKAIIAFAIANPIVAGLMGIAAAVLYLTGAFDKLGDMMPDFSGILGGGGRSYLSADQMRRYNQAPEEARPAIIQENLANAENRLAQIQAQNPEQLQQALQHGLQRWNQSGGLGIMTEDPGVAMRRIMRENGLNDTQIGNRMRGINMPAFQEFGSLSPEQIRNFAARGSGMDQVRQLTEQIRNLRGGNVGAGGARSDTDISSNHQAQFIAIEQGWRRIQQEAASGGGLEARQMQLQMDSLSQLRDIAGNTARIPSLPGSGGGAGA